MPTQLTRMATDAKRDSAQDHGKIVSANARDTIRLWIHLHIQLTSDAKAEKERQYHKHHHTHPHTPVPLYLMKQI